MVSYQMVNLMSIIDKIRNLEVEEVDSIFTESKVQVKEPAQVE